MLRQCAICHEHLSNKFLHLSELLNTCFFVLTAGSYGKWWIGGQKKSDVWYWVGIQTGPVPENKSPNSDWQNAHNESTESTCMYYRTGGAYSYLNMGWDSSVSEPCTMDMYYICERKL